MKLLRIILLGLIIWALSLLWPQINQWVSNNVMLTGVIGGSGLILGYILSNYFQREASLSTQPFPASHRTRDITDTHPIKPLHIA